MSRIFCVLNQCKMETCYFFHFCTIPFYSLLTFLYHPEKVKTSLQILQQYYII